MMPGLRFREERRKKRARVGAFIALSAVVAVTVLLQPGYQWVSLTVGVCGAIAVAASSGDLPGGRGRLGPGKGRGKKRGGAGGFIGCGAIVVSGLFQPGWQWVPLAVGVSAAIAVTASGVPGGRGRGSGLSGRGRDDDDGPAGPAAHRRHLLVIVSRLMPRPAGRRWLAEAESLLSEITAARRGAAIRSYLLSAPRLAAMMWAREARRRARPGPRRPG